MLKVLLIEDDKDDHVFFKRSMKSYTEPYELTWVKSLTEAEALLKSSSFNLIFSDLGLPDSNGADSLDKITSLTKEAPIIVLTGNEDDNLLAEAGQYGISDYLIKSDLNPRLLSRVIRYTLVRFNSEKERMEIEKHLRQSQRVESIGLLTGGIAHDFNNKLAILNCTLEILAQELKSSEKGMKYIETMKAAIISSSKLTGQLLAFGRKQEMDKAKTDLKNTLSNSLKMLERVIKSNITLTVDLSDESLTGLVDETQIDQLIMNLILNAQDAIGGENGSINITAKIVESRNPIGGVDSKDSKFIKISVSDSGSGMDDETKRRAVEPFYSTKSMTDGTGLGLSVVDGIINQHKGFLTIEDNNPRGLCVNVFIPWAHVTPEKSTEKEKSSQKSNLIVLYAEDDETLRELTTEMLEAEGLTIIEACNGIEALEKYEENKSQIDVILSDVVMPKMGGKELFQKIREIDSEIGFIFMSGYSKKELTSDNDQLPKNSKFLKKPCELDDLLECVSIMGNTKIKKTEVA